jgi:LysM repeat protein
MFSQRRHFILFIALAAMMALPPAAFGAGATTVAVGQQQDPEETASPIPTLAGVVIATPIPSGDADPTPVPEETPEAVQPDPTPQSTAQPDPRETQEPAPQPTAHATPTPRPAPAAGEVIRYRVERGDTLYSIARSHGITVAALQETNGLTGTAIQAGQTLIIPSGAPAATPTATPPAATQATATAAPAPPTATPAATHLPVADPGSGQPHPEPQSPDEFDFLATLERYTERFLRWMGPLLQGSPPFAFVGALVGMVNSSLFYLVLGRSLRLFVPFLFLGTAAAVIGVTVSRQLPQSGTVIGEVDLVAASVATWIILLIARSFRL